MSYLDSEVLVIGGGPSGGAAAIELARRGIGVTVLESSNYECLRFGETLPPSVNPTLRELGVWERFIADGHVESPGNISSWGSSDPLELDFCFQADGSGWHIDRNRFDRMLVEHAERMGAQLFIDTRAVKVTKAGRGGWYVATASDSGFRCRYLVLATGRNSGLITPVRGRINYDHLIGVAKLFDLAIPVSDLDHRTCIEAGPDGWWYSAVLPQEKMVVTYMTDADIFAKSRVRSLPADPPPMIRERLNFARRASKTRVLPASSSFCKVQAGIDWCAVGDLSASVDPLSSSGILRALMSGIGAARHIAKASRPSAATNNRPLAVGARSLDYFLRDRRFYYGLEGRWPDSTFWRRRRHDAPLLDGGPGRLLKAG